MWLEIAVHLWNETQLRSKGREKGKKHKIAYTLKNKKMKIKKNYQELSNVRHSGSQVRHGNQTANKTLTPIFELVKNETGLISMEDAVAGNVKDRTQPFYFKRIKLGANVESLCNLLHINDAGHPISLLLLNLVRIMEAFMYSHNGVTIPEFTGAIISKELTVLDAYIYCSRKLKKMNKQDEKAESCKKEILNTKKSIIESYKDDSGQISVDNLNIILMGDPNKLFYAKRPLKE